MGTTGTWRRLVLLLAFGLAAGACASTGEAMLADDAPTTRSPVDRVEDATLVVAALRSSPWAPEARDELMRATRWLDRAEEMVIEEKPKLRRLDLLLTALEGELVRVRALYARLEAEAAVGRALPGGGQ